LIRFKDNNCLTAPASGGGPLTLSACSGTSGGRQRFRFTDSPLGHIRSTAFPNKCLDIAGVSDSDYLRGIGMPTNGLRVSLFDCIGVQYNQKWNISGPLRSVGCSNQCLTRDGFGNDARLSTKPCDGREEQIWDYNPL
jgi:hypothetical protein